MDHKPKLQNPDIAIEINPFIVKLFILTYLVDGESSFPHIFLKECVSFVFLLPIAAIDVIAT